MVTTETITIEVPVGMSKYLEVIDPESELTRNALLLYPYILNQTISHGRAAEILGIRKSELINLYDKFLSELGETGEFVIENSGIILYAKADLVERNTTYEIEEWEPDFFMIGQDGDLAFFIKKDSDDTIYMNDLGALGSIEMKRVASDVYEFVKHSGEGIDWRT